MTDQSQPPIKPDPGMVLLLQVALKEGVISQPLYDFLEHDLTRVTEVSEFAMWMMKETIDAFVEAAGLRKTERE